MNAKQTRDPLNAANRPDPIQIDGHGEQRQWAERFAATSSLQKLVLVSSFYLELSRIWSRIDRPASYLRDLDTWTRAILSCVTNCCRNDLVKFVDQWGNPFHHFQFSTRYCPAGPDKSGRQCGYEKVASTLQTV
jgi:hypothetical protein